MKLYNVNQFPRCRCGLMPPPGHPKQCTRCGESFPSPHGWIWCLSYLAASLTVGGLGILIKGCNG